MMGEPTAMSLVPSLTRILASTPSSFVSQKEEREGGEIEEVYI